MRLRKQTLLLATSMTWTMSCKRWTCSLPSGWSLHAMVKVRFAKQAKRELTNVLEFIRHQPLGKPMARKAAIEAALRDLCEMPEQCRSFKTVGTLVYRVLLVEQRILIPYV